MGRMIGGVVAGVLVAMLVMFAVEAGGHSLFPAPRPPVVRVDPADPAAMAALRDQIAAQRAGLLANVPLGAKLAALLGWFLAALAGGYVADRIGRRGRAGYVIAALIVAGGVWTMVEIPHPMWMQVGGVLLPFLGAFLAERLAHRRY